jgi:MFS family permease
MLGSLPTLFLLKEKLHLGKEQVAVFFLWATFAWNLKPIAGVLTDAFPIFGSRRKVYLVAGATGAAFCWIALGFFHDSYAALLGFSIALNAAIVFASTAMGGLQVEASQAFAAPGRITSLRQIFMSIAQLSAPLLGGWLASKAFGFTAGIAATVLIAAASVTLLVLKEEAREPLKPLSEIELAQPRYKPSIGVLVGIAAFAAAAIACVTNEETRSVGISLLALLAVFFMIIGLAVVPTRNPVIFKAQGQLTQILGSKTLWLAVVMLFLIYTVPGLYTSLTFKQSDELHFSKEFIGRLTAWEAAMGLGAAFAYAAICKHFNLRTLLIGSVLANALLTLTYLLYTRETAIYIHSITGFIAVASELALMDLAVRSTPKGCEALGFALMMSIRNFGIAMSDVIGTKMIDGYGFKFSQLVLINATTTAVVLLFVPMLPRAIMLAREGQTTAK